MWSVKKHQTSIPIGSETMCHSGSVLPVGLMRQHKGVHPDTAQLHSTDLSALFTGIYKSNLNKSTHFNGNQKGKWNQTTSAVMLTDDCFSSADN